MENRKLLNNDLIYYLAFSHFLGIGPIRFAGLIKRFGSAKKAYLAREKEIGEIIGVVLAKKFTEFKHRFDPVKKLEELKKKNIIVLAVDDENYPESLKNISDPPICIYLKSSNPKFFNLIAGPVSNSFPPVLASKNTPRLRAVGIPFSSTPATTSTEKKLVSSPPITFAIVGTRNPTQYGIQVARKFAYELASAGFIIVSGMAYGIDTVAHKSCLDASGKTIAVLGCGVDVVYPAANRGLYEKIMYTGGAIISEFPPGHTVLKGLFVARNRIISALSSGVMIVEGTKNSGSLITARFAAEQGKDVFAPPSPITSSMSSAPNLLLKQGAKLVTSVEDIYEEFNMKITPNKKDDILKDLSKEEKTIFDLLTNETLLIDEIALGLKLPVCQILGIISNLEIKGIIEKNNEGKYQIKL